MGDVVQLINGIKTGKYDDDSIDELAEALEKLNMTDAFAEQILREILQEDQLPSGLTATMKEWLGEMPILLILISFIVLIFVFFGYKLYKSLVERERKRQEKKLQKQHKKKK